MNVSATTALVGQATKFFGETLADLQNRDFARLDSELLRQKRNVLKEKLEALERKVPDQVDLEQKNNQAELTSRGLGGSSGVYAFNLAIENNANERLDEARREYNRAISEIGILEQRIAVRERTLRDKLFMLIFGRLRSSNSRLNWPLITLVLVVVGLCAAWWFDHHRLLQQIGE